MVKDNQNLLKSNQDFALVASTNPLRKRNKKAAKRIPATLDDINLDTGNNNTEPIYSYD